MPPDATAGRRFEKPAGTANIPHINVKITLFGELVRGFRRARLFETASNVVTQGKVASF